jgi:ubiquitin carboxyl-terminal hydrolase 4/11
MSANKIDALVEFPITGLDLSDVVIHKVSMKESVSSLKLSEAEESTPATDSGTSNVDLTDFDNIEPIIYDLYAVSNHFGGLGGGHCMFYLKLL